MHFVSGMNSFYPFSLFLINCFNFSSVGQHGQGIEREIFLDVKTGVEAKNYDDVSVCMCVTYCSVFMYSLIKNPIYFNY